MNKSITTLFVILGTFLYVSRANADAIVASSVLPGAPAYVDILVVFGIVVVIVSVAAWLFLRIIRKKNATHK